MDDQDANNRKQRAETLTPSRTILFNAPLAGCYKAALANKMVKIWK